MAGRDALRAQQAAQDRPREACRVNAEYREDGTLTISVSSVGEFRAGGRVSASFDADEIPEKLKDAVKDAMAAVLDEAHDDLKTSLARDIARTLEMERQGKVPPADFDPETESLEDAMARSAEIAAAAREDSKGEGGDD